MDKQSKNEQMFSGGGGGTGYTENPVFRERDWYRQKIIDKVSQINDAWVLKSIHDFVAGMTKEGN